MERSRPQNKQSEKAEDASVDEIGQILKRGRLMEEADNVVIDYENKGYVPTNKEKASMIQKVEELDEETKHSIIRRGMRSLSNIERTLCHTSSYVPMSQREYMLTLIQNLEPDELDKVEDLKKNSSEVTKELRQVLLKVLSKWKDAIAGIASQSKDKYFLRGGSTNPEFAEFLRGLGCSFPRGAPANGNKFYISSGKMSEDEFNDKMLEFDLQFLEEFNRLNMVYSNSKRIDENFKFGV